MDPRGVEAGDVQYALGGNSMFQMDSRGVEACVGTPKKARSESFRWTLVGLKLEDAGQSDLGGYCFRWTLVGLKRYSYLLPSDGFYSFRWTLVGLKLDTEGRDPPDRLVSDGPSRG